MIRRLLTRQGKRYFMSPDDGGGSSVAAAAPAAPAQDAFPPIGNVFTQALEKERQNAVSQEEADPTVLPAKEKPAAKESEAPAETAAPVSALDAALGDAPTEVKPAEAPAADDPLKDLPETLPRDGRGAHWGKARDLIKTQFTTISQKDKEIGERDAKIAELTAAPAASPELEALRAENAEYKKALVGVNVEFDPEHRKKFVAGRASLVTKAASKLDAYGGKGELIKDALTTMPEGRARNLAIKEALSDLDAIEQQRVMQFVADIEKLDDEKAEIMKDPEGAWNELQKTMSERQREATAKIEENKNKIFENVSKTLSSKIFLLRSIDPTIPGAAEHNAGIAEMQKGARALLSPDAKPEDVIEAAYWKQAGPKLDKILRETLAELKTARATLKEYESAEPGFKGGRPAAKSSTEQKLEKSPGTIFKETMAALSEDR